MHEVCELSRQLDKKQLSVEPPRPSALNMTLPAFATKRGRLQDISIDSWYAAPAPAAIDRRSAANQPHAAATVDWRDRQTYGYATVT